MNERRFGIIGLLALLLLSFECTAAQRFCPRGEAGHSYSEFAERIRIRLMKGLVFERHLPRGKNGRFANTSTYVYILGGRQDAIRYKLKTVGHLHQEGPVKKFLVLDRPGITEYSQALGRNLTNDEWTITKLEEEGVSDTQVEFVSIPPSVFNTFAEAQRVSALVRSRGATRLVLVSSMHHTERVWLSFSHFNVDNKFELFIYGSEEKIDAFELLREYLKLFLYRYFVLPIDRLCGGTRNSPAFSS